MKGEARDPVELTQRPNMVLRNTPPPDSQDGLLELRDVCKIYRGSAESKVVFDRISFQVTKGELVALVGPSGAGKSTLLRLILGQERPTSGELLLDGEPLGYPDIRRGIVPQHYGLFPHLTVIENLMLGDRLDHGWLEWRKNRGPLRDRAEDFLRAADLAENRDKYPHQLSGGQQQRAAVMQALLRNPTIVLMDEPFGALDPGTRERMQVFLLTLWEERKKTILFVTHDLEEAVFLAPRIIALSPYNKIANTIGTSRIVYDETVRDRWRALSTESKKDPRFTETIEAIRDIAYEPDREHQVDDFDDRHPSDFGTTGAAASDSG
ncbi:MAG TPA: ABC transporter ATP-binding protein [Thermoanaerobaculia bacterium]|jgi:NitT/TauT family transport system ATP-binding protein|nr:ABC transporter ATP-binding protein [Thermoanaerobaculia bacterium]